MKRAITWMKIALFSASRQKGTAASAGFIGVELSFGFKSSFPRKEKVRRRSSHVSAAENQMIKM